MNRIRTTVILAAALTIASAFGQQQGKGNNKGKGRTPRQDMATIPRPIDMHDTVWIEDMTQLEVRDSLKAGKTTALVFAGGMEDNGPYVTVSQHNLIVHAMCDSIARKLGNALCAPIVPMAPGNPETAKIRVAWCSPAIPLSPWRPISRRVSEPKAFKTSCSWWITEPTRGPMKVAAKALSEKWAGSGAAAYYVPEFYNYDEVEKFEKDVLGVTETREGFHDDYYTASISVAIDPVEARMQERIKA